MQIFWKIDYFTGTFQRFCLDFNNNFFSDWLSMAVSDKFSWSCRKGPKQKPVLSKGFVIYLNYYLLIKLLINNLIN